ncbi:MAG: hypothetical protein LBJ13_01835 [Puniceicoccales bacterium]|nr:hypothetical protein [Puniceicoccales bacterium]
MENSNVLRNMACNILGGVGINSIKSGDLTKPSGSYLDRLKSAPSGGMAQAIFKSKLSTTELVKMANKALDSHIANSSDKSQFTAAKGTIADMRKKQSHVNHKQFLSANPLTPLHKISRDATATKTRKLGEGGLGTVHLAEAKDTAWETQKLVVKEAKSGGEKALAIEGKAGQSLANAYNDINQDTPLSSVQGLTVVAVPIMQNDGTVIQEAINGNDGGDAIYGKANPNGTSTPPIQPFVNKFVDNPQKAIERACNFALGLHGIHETGDVHHDLKLGNIMFEKQELPGGVTGEEWEIRIIDLGATSQAGQIQTINSPNTPPEHFAATERVKEIRADIAQRANAGNPVIGEERSRLQAEINEGFATANRPSYDIYSMGTMLPALLFGQGGEALSRMFEAPQNPLTGEMELNSSFIAMCQQQEIETKIDLMEEGTAKTQMSELSSKLKELDTQFRSKVKNLPKTRLDHAMLKKTIAADEAKLTTLNEGSQERRTLHRDISRKKQQLEGLHSSIDQTEKLAAGIRSTKKEMEKLLSDNFPADKADKAKRNAHAKIRQHILSQFQPMNMAMEEATGKKYPPEVLGRLAHMIADCLAMDPSKRPTAEHVLLGLQNMGLSEWERGKYNIDLGQTQTLTLGQQDIRKQFPWIGA